MKKINKNIQQEINELNQFFEDMEKSLFTEYSEKDFELIKKNYEDTDMISNFRLYQHRYHSKEEEYLYFLINITIPDKIDIYPSSLNKCLELTKFFDRLKLTSEFILKNEKDKKNYEKH